MAVTTVNTLKLSDVCLEIYGSSTTLGRSLIGCYNAATAIITKPSGSYTAGTFNGSYNTVGSSTTLLDFRGYVHGFLDIWGYTFGSTITSGGTSTFPVYSNISWTISEDSTWASLSPTSGTGDATITITYGANSSNDSRTTNITLVGTGSASTLSDTAIFTQDGVAADTTSPVFQNNGFNSGVYISDEGTNTILCTWKVTDNIGVTSHRIYYSANGGAYSFATLNQTNGNNIYDYQLTGLSASTPYTVYVRSYDAAGNFTNSATDSTTTLAAPDTTSPTYPTQLTLGTITSTSIQLNWVSADNVGVTSHQIYVNNSVHATIAGNATTYTVTGLTPSTAYDVYVRAYDAAGNFSNSTAYGNATTSAGADTQAPTFSPNLTIGTVTTSSVQLNWASQDNVGVTSQVLYHRIPPGTWQTNTLSASATTYTKTGLNAGTNYEFYVRVCDAATNCVSSVTQSVATVANATLSISPTSYSSGDFSESFFLTITTTAAWTLTDDSFWITPNATSGTGNGIVNVTITKNLDVPRSGIITVSIPGTSINCNISQDGGSGPV